MSVKKELKKAVAFGIIKNKKTSENIEELRALAKTANYEIEAEFFQKGIEDRKFLVRRGKVKEIAEFIKQNHAEIAICNNILSSSQALALEEELKIPVIDRVDLILNIFELHAKSKEAKLQIELARLRKKLPFIKAYLSRKIKAEHPGFGSSGEYIIRGSLTMIKRRIKRIEEELDEFERRNEVQRKKRRSKGKIIALAGYTNVGKSSLAKALTNKEVISKNELFTTLRTKTLAYNYKGELFMVSDTIGFIRELPAMLIAAFKATLSDIINSDLILLVHDVSNKIEEIKEKKKVSEKAIMNVFLKYSSEAMPAMLNVFNKADLINEKKKEEIIKELGLKHALFLSAKERLGINELKEEIYNAVSGNS